MASNNNVRMPSSGGGLTTFYDESKSKIHIPPQAVLGVTLLVVIVIILLNTL